VKKETAEITFEECATILDAENGGVASMGQPGPGALDRNR
jgi:hypothetical protein